MPNIILNEAEINKFYGVCEFDVKLYITIRKFMDGETQITGIKRGISWQSLSEEMWIDPVRGSTASAGSPSKKKLRCAARRLLRKGLLDVLSEDKQLIFKCVLASRGYSVKNMKGRGRAQMRATSEDQENPTNKGYFESEDSLSGIPKNAKKGTPLISIYKNKKYISPLPPNFEVTDLHREYASRHQLPSPDNEIEGFKDYHLAHGSTFANWDAAFRNWLRKAKQIHHDKKEYHHARSSTYHRTTPKQPKSKTDLLYELCSEGAFGKDDEDEKILNPED